MVENLINLNDYLLKRVIISNNVAVIRLIRFSYIQLFSIVITFLKSKVIKVTLLFVIRLNYTPSPRKSETLKVFTRQ